MPEDKPKKGKRTVTVLLTGIVLGIVLWSGFNAGMEATNTETFCSTSCHEMEVNVYQEYMDTNHYVNRTGVRATCPDCHVPQEGIPKFVRKLQASREVYHHLLGTIDTPEKFDAERMELARHVWRAMKETDSRECRNCHESLSMDYDKQEPRSAERHEQAEAEGLTCIDCHKGIAHRLPAEYDPEQDIPGESIYYDEANTSL
ncbi:NapC/NirT family cytochrome c [Candidatus Thiosymbion oneisti]|uniref:NapC/NirT family cytochrome c n=1 Tax=Candidatus Thiosymbion oneisti TaxID=589554 RepID=UPI000AC322B2|nr:NapC/NirT family cytochrome c [Candidatus Thiosymbion oneisti]